MIPLRKSLAETRATAGFSGLFMVGWGNDDVVGEPESI